MMLVRVGKEGKERAGIMRKVLKRLLVGYEEDPETTEISMGRKSLDLKSLCRSRNPGIHIHIHIDLPLYILLFLESLSNTFTVLQELLRTLSNTS